MATADKYPIMLTGADREPFHKWLNRCRDLGAASTMTDAIRLAVRLGGKLTDEQIKQGAGPCSTNS
jgi:hypothetical protein